MSDGFTDAEGHEALDRLEASGGIPDADIESFLRSAERAARQPRRREGFEPGPAPTLRYDGPGAEANYATILHSERFIDSLDASPAVWGLGVASPMLRHEQEWLDRIAPPSRHSGRFKIESKRPLFAGGRVTGVVWKGKVYITEQRVIGDWITPFWDNNEYYFTMLHYQNTEATACYITGKARRIFPVKIW